MKKVKGYPADCLTDADHTEYLYRAEELLRLEHNDMGTKYREGKITGAAWDAFRNEWDERSLALTQEIVAYRRKHKESKRWAIDVVALFEER